jgi:ElaB/YqjD/DUF883 family membrane-anchored ribosome-binding protein
MADPIASTSEKRGRRAAGKGAPAASTEPLHDPDALAPPRASAASDALERQAGPIGEQLRAAAESLLSEQKERAAEAVHCLADVLRQAADTFEREERGIVAHYVDAAAAQIDRVSETMHRRSLEDVLASAEDVARRQPALFLTGAVAVGFLVGRVLSRVGDGDRPHAEGYAMTAGNRSGHAGSAPRGGGTGMESS